MVEETREDRWARRADEQTKEYYKNRAPGEQIHNNDKHGFIESIRRRANTEIAQTKHNIQQRIEHPEIYKAEKRAKRIKELEAHSRELRAELEHAHLRKKIYNTQHPQPHPLSRRAYYAARQGHRPKKPKQPPIKSVGIPDIMSGSDILGKRYW